MIQPIYLFADSQLLFWQDNGQPFLNSLKSRLPGRPIKAAYIGASNNDQIEFFQLFEGAMASIGIDDCRMIRSFFSESECDFLTQADLILLAGGDVAHGWHIMQTMGMHEIITKRYYDGALLIGISAGAVQLGLCGCRSSVVEKESLIDTLKLTPFVIGAHEEKDDWALLNQIVQLRGGYEKGIGIPSGGGMIYHTDHTVEPIRHPLHECYLNEDHLATNLLFPGEAKEPSSSEAQSLEGKLVDDSKE